MLFDDEVQNFTCTVDQRSIYLDQYETVACGGHNATQCRVRKKFSIVIFRKFRKFSKFDDINLKNRCIFKFSKVLKLFP